MGIDALSQYRQAHRRVKSRGRLAAMLALVPGLGAVFNHQNVKAIFHFVGVMLLFQLTEIRALDAFFALGGTAFYFYTIVDAYRTAERIARGEDPQEDEARFKRALFDRARGLGVLLLAAGALLLIQLLHPFGIDVSLVRLLPVILILVGGYLLVSHVKRSREEEVPPVYTPRPHYPLISVESQVKRVRQYAASGRGDRADDLT
jgi:Na+/H+ antiporter NhaD/arsenite permease-like protein